MKQPRVPVIPMVVLSILFGGCVIIPIPSEKDDVTVGKCFTEDRLNFLQKGITLKEEVIDRLGQPNSIWKQKNIFAYQWINRWGYLYVVGTTIAGGITVGQEALDIQNLLTLYQTRTNNLQL